MTNRRITLIETAIMGLIKHHCFHEKGPAFLHLKSNMTYLKANYKRKYENSFRRCGGQEENIENVWQYKKFTEGTSKTENY